MNGLIYRRIIDNFEGPEKSIDYDEDEFVDWSHHKIAIVTMMQKYSTHIFLLYDKKVTFNVRVLDYIFTKRCIY